ncbi:ABC transporter ATP-binding protein [Streptomyces sp. MI02-7b]|uniref:ABC transporter ATP-binding protein n=1 Tax=Streptomyces sp. MI02-7b TaxID=462941 RepID=UPI0029B75F9F|nr:ABC transporter ATP-binding protein [Streptomyces sp. MI02-7b]MDX3075117.1 ABC transporter ATP-binding protein [Streptomyces sp. MI02-7b]
MNEETAAVEASGLTVGYPWRREPVLRDCAFRLPAGRICALVGPNGAGKSTLLAVAAGLLRPAEGEIRVFGKAPAAARARVAYVAQDKPLYPHLTVAATLRLGAELNPDRWHHEAATRIVEAGGLSPKARIRSLSGGQRTRVALALALGKRPDLLLLDEPMSGLDPQARHELTGALLAEAVEHGTTVVMSSHIVSELEDSCDHLLLLGGGQVRLAGGIEELLAAHRLLTGVGEDHGTHTVVEQRASGRGRTALVRPGGAIDGDRWLVENPGLDELVLAHLRNPGAPALVIGSSVPTSRQEATA